MTEAERLVEPREDARKSCRKCELPKRICACRDAAEHDAQKEPNNG